MITTRNLLGRPLAALSAFALLAGAVVPSLLVGQASADQVTSRSIQLSRATGGASGVTYKVTFTAQKAAQNVIVDFCADSPIIAQSCTGLPTGMVISGASTPTANWTVTAVGGGNTTALKATRTTSWSATNVITFEITGITNPTISSGTNQSFYARLTTYTNANVAGYTTPTSVGTYEDYGGIAMSVNADITISATVMETLTFCTSLNAPGPGCSTTQAPAVTIGSGSPSVLDASRIDTGTAHTQLSTNASSGAVVNLKTVNTATCAGLSRNNGTDNCPIAAINQASPTQITNGTGRFGLTVSTSTGDTGVTADASYAGVPTIDPTNRYNLVQTEALSTYGSPLMSSTGPVTNADNLLTYAATPTNTTPAGIYSTAQSLIATGTF